MGACEMMLLLFLLSATASHADMTLVSYEDIHMDSDTMMFHKSSIDSFLHLIFHPSLPHLFIGSRNHVMRLDARNLSLLESVEWKPTQKQNKTCLNREISKGGCENYIRMLALHPKGDLVMCGTYAYSPACSWRNGSNISIETKKESGLGRCPSNIHSNFSYLMSKEGDLYTGLMLDTGGFDPAIVRTIGPSKPLRSEKSNSLWFDDAQFVAMFDIEEYIYIFFREVALEKLSCGKSIVSRVARICKSDKGGSAYVLKDSWTTFVKASLNCSRPGEYPLYYNEVQDVKYDPQRKVFTALFATSPTGLHSSAVCEYSLRNVNKSMSGSFYIYDQRQKVWKTKTSKYSRKCPSEDDKPMKEHVRQHMLMMISQLQLSQHTIQPTQQHPIIEQPNKRYNKIEVENLKGHCSNRACHIRVIYMSSIEGVIEKFVVVPHNHTIHHHHHQTLRTHPAMKKSSYYCRVERVQLLPPDLPQAVHFLRINPFNKQLLIGTKDRVYQLPRFRCHKYTNKQRCDAAQDPHCAWDGEACKASSVHQVSSCPVSHLLVRHKYVWSGWSGCSVSCGKGIQMKIRLCLDDANQLCNEELSNHHSTKNFQTRPCIGQPCSYQNEVMWSPWLTNGNVEQRYKCECEQKHGGCEAAMVKSERLCTNSTCGSRLKRVVQKNKRTYHHYKRYHHNPKYVLKKNDPRHLHNHLNFTTKNVIPSAYKQKVTHKTTKPMNDQKIHAVKHPVRVSNNLQQPCPQTCLKRTPVSMGLFYGYCGCRDVGVFRVCHKCH